MFRNNKKYFKRSLKLLFLCYYKKYSELCWKIKKGKIIMNSIFFSKIEIGMDIVKEKLNTIIPDNSKVAIFPWAFPVEIDSDKLENDFFKKGERRYNRYINELKKIGIKEENITI